MMRRAAASACNRLRWNHAWNQDQLPHEDAVKPVERLDRGVVARSKR